MRNLPVSEQWSLSCTVPFLWKPRGTLSHFKFQVVCTLHFLFEFYISSSTLHLCFTIPFVFCALCFVHFTAEVISLGLGDVILHSIARHIECAVGDFAHADKTVKVAKWRFGWVLP